MCRFFCELDVGACIFYENVSIETFNISFEGTQNKLQYGTNIISTEVRKRLWCLERVTTYRGFDL